MKTMKEGGAAHWLKVLMRRRGRCAAVASFKKSCRVARGQKDQEQVAYLEDDVSVDSPMVVRRVYTTYHKPEPRLAFWLAEPHVLN